MSDNTKEKLEEVVNVSMGLTYAIDAIKKLESMAFDDLSEDAEKLTVMAVLKNHREGLEQLLGNYDLLNIDGEMLLKAEEMMAQAGDVKRRLDS